MHNGTDASPLFYEFPLSRIHPFFPPCSSAGIIQILHFSPTTLLVLTECAIKNEICVCTANPHFGSVLFHSGEKENRIGRSLET